MPVGGAILGSAVIGGAVGLSSASKAAKASEQANAQNAALARENAARNEALLREQQLQNAGLITGARDQTTDLLTGARDQTASLLGDQQRANFGTATNTHEDALRIAEQNRVANQSTINSGQGEIIGRSDWTAMRNDADLLAARQAALTAAEAARSGNAKTLADTRDTNVNLFKTTGAANESDITGYGDRAAGAITGVMDEQRNMFNPFVKQGTLATDRINALLNLSGDPRAADDAFKAFRDSTGYDFQVKEAERGTLGNSAALGLLESGSAAKALSDRRQGIADNSFNGYYDKLSGQQGVGLNAAGSLSSALTSGAGQLSNVYQNTGSSLVGNRNNMTAGQVGANADYSSGTLANNNSFRDATTNAGTNYATASTANQNNRLATQAGAITNATGATVSNNNGYANATTGANNLFGTQITDANNGYYGGQTNNTNAFAANQASNLTGAAQYLAGLNTSTANGVISGNNNATSAVAGGNTANAQTQGNAALGNAQIINGVLQNGANAFAYYKTPTSKAGSTPAPTYSQYYNV